MTERVRNDGNDGKDDDDYEDDVKDGPNFKRFLKNNLKKSFFDFFFLKILVGRSYD